MRSFSRPGAKSSFLHQTVLLACLICAALAGSAVSGMQEPANSATAPDRTAAQVLAEAQAQLKSYTSIQADVTEAVSMGARKFRATGKYAQALDNRIRVTFDLQPLEGPGKKKSDTAASLLQVCDGQMLWTQISMGGRQRIERRDIQDIMTALKDDPSFHPDKLGLGGIPALLSSLQNRMSFKGVRTEEREGKPFVVVQGRWSDEQLLKFLPDNEEADPLLPPYLPEYVRIYFEEETLFPRRIVYLKRHPNPEQRLARPMLTLDFTNIVLNGELDPELFRFSGSGNQNQVDITDELIKAFKGESAAPPAGEAGGAPGPTGR